MSLLGTEIKSIRNNKANISDAHCVFIDDELYVKSLHIAEYTNGGYINHEPKRDRKLLLNRQELNKMLGKVTEKGNAIIPIRLFINEKGKAKLEIALAKGKKVYDKRESIKEKDQKRDMDRIRNMR
jgi:SsrA-binding protein